MNTGVGANAREQDLCLVAKVKWFCMLSLAYDLFINLLAPEFGV
jgi:hypothetical protein